jgi:hypothetical protein
MMKPRATLIRTLLALSSLAAGFSGDRAMAQQQSLKDQLIGTWKLVSASMLRGDGSKQAMFGSDPKGILIFTSDGQFALVNLRSDLPKLASSNRAKATADEAQAVVAGSIAYYGTYSVSESDRVIAVKIEQSTFANQVGGVDQNRLITSLTATSLTFTNPASQSGAVLQLVWVRAL